MADSDKPNYAGHDVSALVRLDCSYVTGISLTFRNKVSSINSDAILKIEVFGETGVLVASKKIIVGNWIEKTTYLAALDLKSAMEKSLLSSGAIHLALLTVGAARWRFQCQMDISFSESTITVKQFAATELTHEEPTADHSWTLR